MPVLRNCNPIGEVDVRLIGREGDNGVYADPDDRGYSERTPTPGSGCLERGEEFEVSKEHAGRPPAGWRALGANPIPKGATLRTNGQMEVEVFDPGEGLLAQAGIYELVKQAKSKGSE